LIYFIYGQKQFSDKAIPTQVQDVTTDNRGSTAADVVPSATIDEVTPPVVTTTPQPTATTTVTPPVVVQNSAAILARYNPRNENTLKLQ
jgi:hypothetical protein